MINECLFEFTLDERVYYSLEVLWVTLSDEEIQFMTNVFRIVFVFLLFCEITVSPFANELIELVVIILSRK